MPRGVEYRGNIFSILNQKMNDMFHSAVSTLGIRNNYCFSYQFYRGIIDKQEQHTFNVYNLISLDICKLDCHHHHNQDKNHMLHLVEISCAACGFVLF